MSAKIGLKEAIENWFFAHPNKWIGARQLAFQPGIVELIDDNQACATYKKPRRLSLDEQAARGREMIVRKALYHLRAIDRQVDGRQIPWPERRGEKGKYEYVHVLNEVPQETATPERSTTGNSHTGAKYHREQPHRSEVPQETATPERSTTATPERTPTATPERTPTATPERTPTATPERSTTGNASLNGHLTVAQLEHDLELLDQELASLPSEAKLREQLARVLQLKGERDLTTRLLESRRPRPRMRVKALKRTLTGAYGFIEVQTGADVFAPGEAFEGGIDSYRVGDEVILPLGVHPDSRGPRTNRVQKC